MVKFSLLEVYKKFDIFGRDVSLNVNGKVAVNSCIGATMSILVTFVTLAYAWTRFNILVQFEDTRFQETTTFREDYENEMFR